MGGDGESDTGGNGDNTNVGVWDDENTGTLWGWLDSVVGGLKTVWETLTSLPRLIWDYISQGFDNVVEWLKDLWSSIEGLPSKILDGIKAVFIPDRDYINTAFNSFTDEMAMKFSFDTDFFESLFQAETPVEDITTDYTVPFVGTFKFKVFDKSFFVEGVKFFRPFIRGFLVLLMLLYHIKQLIGFFGYNAGVVAGRSDGIVGSMNSQRSGE